MNKVILTGHIASAPSFYEDKNKTFLTIAVSKFYNNQEHTTFIPLSIFGKTAKSIFVNTKVGDLVEVEGELSIFQTQENQEWKQIASVFVQKYKKLRNSSKLNSVADKNSKQQPNFLVEKLLGNDIDFETEADNFENFLKDELDAK